MMASRVASQAVTFEEEEQCRISVVFSFGMCLLDQIMTQDVQQATAQLLQVLRQASKRFNSLGAFTTGLTFFDAVLLMDPTL